MSTYSPNGYRQVEIPFSGLSQGVYPTTCSQMETYLGYWKTVFQLGNATVTDVPAWGKIETDGDLGLSFCVSGSSDAAFYQLGLTGNIHSVIIDDANTCCNSICQTDLNNQGFDQIFDLGSSTQKVPLHLFLRGAISTIYSEANFEVVWYDHVESGGTVSSVFLLRKDDDWVTSVCSIPTLNIGGLLSTTVTQPQIGGFIVETANSVVAGNTAQFWMTGENPAVDVTPNVIFRVLNNSDWPLTLNSDTDPDPHWITLFKTGPAQEASIAPNYLWQGWVGDFSSFFIAPDDPVRPQIAFGALKLKPIEGEGSVPNIKKASFVIVTQNDAGSKKLFYGMELHSGSLGLSKYKFKYKNSEITQNTVDGAGIGNLSVLSTVTSSDNSSSSSLRNGFGWHQYGTKGSLSTTFDTQIHEPWCGFNPFDYNKWPYSFAQLWDMFVCFRGNLDFGLDETGKQPFRWDGQWWFWLSSKLNAPTVREPFNALALRVTDTTKWTAFGNSGPDLVELDSFVSNSVFTQETTVTVIVTLKTAPGSSGSYVNFSCRDSERVQFSPSLVTASGITVSTMMVINNLGVSETITLECASKNVITQEVTIV